MKALEVLVLILATCSSFSVVNNEGLSSGSPSNSYNEGSSAIAIF